jgi:nitroreductase
MAVDLSGQAIPAVKHAETNFEVIPQIRNRWSPRAFLEKSISREQVNILLEAARWSASCFNEQPWRFVVAFKEDKAGFEKMLAVLVEKNQAWAKAAPVLMVSFAKKTFAHNGKPNKHGLHDTGAAACALALQAASMGMQIHQMAGFDGDKARAAYGVPDDFEPAAAIAIGYPAPANAAPEEFRKGELAPRVRKGVKEIAFEGKWGEAVKG